MTTTKAQRSLGGRPSHAPTARTRRSVIDLVAAGFSQDRIAGEVGIDAKTLRLHYREELGFGEAITEARLAQNVMRLTKCRNKSVALKATIYLLQAKFGWGEYAPPSKPPPLGKKEQAQRAAEEGLEDDTDRRRHLSPVRSGVCADDPAARQRRSIRPPAGRRSGATARTSRPASGRRRRASAWIVEPPCLLMCRFSNAGMRGRSACAVAGV